MRNILALIGLVVVLFVGVGLYRGWYELLTGADGSRTIKLDEKKIIEDEQAAQKKIADAIKNQTNGTNGTPVPPPPPPPKEVPGQTTGWQFREDGTYMPVPPKVNYKSYE